MAGAGLLALLSGCAGDRIDALGLRETESGLVELVTTCANDLTAKIEESGDELRVTEIEGEPVDGDCEGVLVVQLGAPLGGRQVIVEGEPWVELPPGCPWGELGPPDLGDRNERCASE